MQLKWPMLWDLFSLFPAHAGVIPLTMYRPPPRYSFPRTRGGDPVYYELGQQKPFFSPHTRG